MKNNPAIAIVDASATREMQPPSTGSSQARRGVFLKWLRKMHGWIGLWGAALGLLFGVTGILQNHRAILKIPAAQAEESTVQLPLPTPAPADTQAMANWLQQELKLDRAATRVKSEKPRPVAWGDKTLKQPAHWSAAFSSPRVNLQTDYWVGNSFITVKRNDNNVFGTLNNLHKGVGVGIGWILLADTLAGSIILLSLTGVILWSQLNRRRLIGAAIGLTSLGLMIVLSLQSM
ncbi:MAG: PepSY-associated TM helix domain-containing protein [Burkholderiaceae bacterium]